MKFEKYLSTVIGKSIDYDKAFGVQCVDLIDHYIVNCLELNIGFYGDAKDWLVDFYNSKWLRDNFVCMFDVSQVKAGDIVVRSSGKFGHIAIATSYCNNNKFKIIEQNKNGTIKKVVDSTVNVTDFNGILRPKKGVEHVEKYGNATVLKDIDVFSSNLCVAPTVGKLFRNDRVKILGTAKGKYMVSYPITGGYKVGIIKNNSDIRKD